MADDVTTLAQFSLDGSREKRSLNDALYLRHLVTYNVEYDTIFHVSLSSRDGAAFPLCFDLCNETNFMVMLTGDLFLGILQIFPLYGQNSTIKIAHQYIQDSDFAYIKSRTENHTPQNSLSQRTYCCRQKRKIERFGADNLYHKDGPYYPYPVKRCGGSQSSAVVAGGDSLRSLSDSNITVYVGVMCNEFVHSRRICFPLATHPIAIAEMEDGSGNLPNPLKEEDSPHLRLLEARCIELLEKRIADLEAIVTKSDKAVRYYCDTCTKHVRSYSQESKLSNQGLTSNERLCFNRIPVYFKFEDFQGSRMTNALQFIRFAIISWMKTQSRRETLIFVFEMLVRKYLAMKVPQYLMAVASRDLKIAITKQVFHTFRRSFRKLQEGGMFHPNKESVDRLVEPHINLYQCSFGLADLNLLQITGRVVDFDSYIQHAPNTGIRAPMGDALFSARYDECRCGTCTHNTALNRNQRRDFDDYSRSKSFTDEQYLFCPLCVLGYHIDTQTWIELEVDQVVNISQPGLVQSHTSGTGKQPMMEDIVSGKGKGLVILLHGPPRVGKTSTAESVAPTSNNLESLFKLAARWRAVLLLEEDICFRESRSSHTSDLTHNALVSRYLDPNHEPHQPIRHRRLISQEENLPEVHRRIILNWFRDDPYAPEWFESLNGRQLRNVLSSAASLALKDGEDLRLDHIKTMAKITVKFQESLRVVAQNARIKSEAGLYGNWVGDFTGYVVCCHCCQSLVHLILAHHTSLYPSKESFLGNVLGLCPLFILRAIKCLGIVDWSSSSRRRFSYLRKRAKPNTASVPTERTSAPAYIHTRFSSSIRLKCSSLRPSHIRPSFLHNPWLLQPSCPLAHLGERQASSIKGTFYHMYFGH
ncbi:uncharacterized protein BDR25DRAFT_356505 [Lindgomyces ingoldianus]|uniref:Uncharacterized protein n=1 Tax=Lindgomyces ingoldianus TaxID=673940 RepID=A0ACB6QQJ5_9PLEO|nr:uncharacterized protein BDR25DRAFT_356505 [Lindgomyces ingoldianus]KAF2469258.1 hypothetical protein BDR25DRAFT_356505 [Lindgomyces ingoldianus]